MADPLEPIVARLADTLLTLNPAETADHAAQAVRALLTERQHLPLCERFDLSRAPVRFCALAGETPYARAALLDVLLAETLTPAEGA